MQSLTNIGGEFWIDNNDLLTDISPLENLNVIGLSLYVVNNAILNNMSGLDNINPGSIVSLNIYNNPLLSECDVQSICDYLAVPNALADIHDNAVGCNSPAEVQEACLTTVEEITSGNGITIIPNPSKDKITILSPALTGITQLSIFNVSGEKVIERLLRDTETQIDISALTRGVYIVRVQNEKMVEVGKMVKE